MSGRPRSVSMRVQLVAFSTLLAAGVILLAFMAVSIAIREQTRRWLTQTVGHSQDRLRSQQKNNLTQLLATSSLITENPTLRAAMDTYRMESVSGTRSRPDLLATVDNEARKIVAALRRDLLIITDERGTVMASVGSPGELPATEENVAGWAVVREALEPSSATLGGQLAVVRTHGKYYQVGCVPIVLQGYVIGTLTLGDRIDQRFVSTLRKAFDDEILITANGLVIASSFPAGSGVEFARLAAAVALAAPSNVATTVKAGKQEYVTLALPLGAGEDGQPVILYPLHSLTDALDGPKHELFMILLLHGCLAVIVAGSAAWVVSGSILGPLKRFVRFLEEVARTGDHGHRFAVSRAPQRSRRSATPTPT